MRLRIAALGGDGVGPEVTEAALRVVEAVGAREEWQLEVERLPIGWSAVETHGDPLPEVTRAGVTAADAVFLGAVGSPAARGAPRALRPETGLLALRRALGCWANLRPTRIPHVLVPASPLRPERASGVDLLVVRELAGGLYYGEPRGEDEDHAWNTLRYTRDEIRRVADLAFRIAAGRGGRVVSVDKENVLEVSRLWRRVVEEVAAAHPDVRVEHILVDRAALELVLRPRDLDVVVTANLFGDILTDEASALAGSLGVAGSASLGGTTDLYEPVHGSAPDLGPDEANPMGAFASLALLFRHTADRPDLADALDRAVERTLEAGIATADLAPALGFTPVGTRAFTTAVLEQLEQSA